MVKIITGKFIFPLLSFTLLFCKGFDFHRTDGFFKKIIINEQLLYGSEMAGEIDIFSYLNSSSELCAIFY